jgi:hypothetical protein
MGRKRWRGRRPCASTSLIIASECLFVDLTERHESPARPSSHPPRTSRIAPGGCDGSGGGRRLVALFAGVGPHSTVDGPAKGPGKAREIQIEGGVPRLRQSAAGRVRPGVPQGE